MNVLKPQGTETSLPCPLPPEVNCSWAFLSRWLFLPGASSNLSGYNFSPGLCPMHSGSGNWPFPSILLLPFMCLTPPYPILPLSSLPWTENPDSIAGSLWVIFSRPLHLPVALPNALTILELALLGMRTLSHGRLREQGLGPGVECAKSKWIWSAAVLVLHCWWEPDCCTPVPRCPLWGEEVGCIFLSFIPDWKSLAEVCRQI